jgi:hypothetical protein
MGRGQAVRSRKPDSGHTGLTSIRIRMRRASWNAMKPRVQCVLDFRGYAAKSSQARRRVLILRVLAGQGEMP